MQATINLATTISKLSPLVGNMIEFTTCDYLNANTSFSEFGKWFRQDPGFPDTIFLGSVTPNPGFEIKAWFPLATEITARFKDSYSYFYLDQTYVVLMAWLPEFVIFGRPCIIDVVCISAAEIAKSRDMHYHQPPGYIILEPHDTSSRTANLQQTNTNGFIFQGSPDEFSLAQTYVLENGLDQGYQTDENYQQAIRKLFGSYKYRLDTNFAKIDRIKNSEIDQFKIKVMNTPFQGRTIKEWQKILSSKNDSLIITSLTESLNFSFQ